MRSPPFLASLKVRIALFASILLALLIVAWGQVVITRFREAVYVHTEHEGRFFLTALRPFLINAFIHDELGLMNNTPLLDSFVGAVEADTNIRTRWIVVLNRHAEVMASSARGSADRETSGQIIVDAMKQRDVLSRIVSNIGGRGHNLEMAMPLEIEGKIWGGVGISLSLEDVEKTIDDEEKNMLLASMVVFIFFCAVFLALHFRMMKPLEELGKALAAVGTDAETLPVLEPRNDEIGVLQKSFNRMISRLRASESERKAAMEVVVQHEKMATMGKLVAGVVHEINNPLGALSFCAERLAEVGDPRVADEVEILGQAGERLAGIVRQLRDLSHASTLNLQKVRTDIFFAEIASFVRFLPRLALVTVTTVDLVTEPVEIEIDKGKLHQVVLDLLFNAADASPDGATVKVVAFNDEDQYCISVSDEGIGIPEENVEKIFTLFYTTKPPEKGSGIGLAVCKHILELHGGRIDVTSRPGRTTFTACIPLKGGGHVEGIDSSC